jgi:hypothetical protein
VTVGAKSLSRLPSLPTEPHDGTYGVSLPANCTVFLVKVSRSSGKKGIKIVDQIMISPTETKQLICTKPNRTITAGVQAWEPLLKLPMKAMMTHSKLDDTKELSAEPVKRNTVVSQFRRLHRKSYPLRVGSESWNTHTGTKTLSYKQKLFHARKTGDFGLFISLE